MVIMNIYIKVILIIINTYPTQNSHEHPQHLLVTPASFEQHSLQLATPKSTPTLLGMQGPSTFLLHLGSKGNNPFQFLFITHTIYDQKSLSLIRMDKKQYAVVVVGISPHNPALMSSSIAMNPSWAYTTYFTLLVWDVVYCSISRFGNSISIRTFYTRRCISK